MRRGDIVVFKGSGLAFGIFGRLLRLFESRWDRWGWHMAYVERLEGTNRVPLIVESVGSGVARRSLRFDEEYRSYRWFDAPPETIRLIKFTNRHLGCAYDAAVYFWTILQYLALHFFNRGIPRLLDDRFTCWELVFLMCREMGKPIQSLHKYPVITDFLTAMEEHR